MKKNIKILIIVISIIVVLAIAAGLIYFFVINNSNQTESNDEQTSKITKLYQTLQEKEEYTFSMTVDDNNKLYYAKKGDTAYSDSFYNGEESKFVTTNGNAYLITDGAYYKYQNNDADITKISAKLQEIETLEVTKGEESIENKNYRYEEYETSQFIIKNLEKDEEKNIKTRFYFDKDKLVYIKTIFEDAEELSKIEISYNADDKLFELPSDYEER